MIQDRRVKDNDIALIKVDHPFIFNYDVSGACLSTRQEDRDETEQLFAAGWGLTETRNQSPEKLLHANLTTVPIDKCREQYELSGRRNILGQRQIHDTQYCAIGELINEAFISDPCTEDSGGPLYYEEDTPDGKKFKLVGVISYTINCMGYMPGVYVRVASYLDWIASVAGSLEDW
ncbi:hypothetical protein ZHAS_00004609 [Anopheles sinensis]|uniref:Peptidase S1 domain-containing protein n=1 Tax=Anopheles sinensis TaxID=74873 RepID=A0A084VHM7_ANOSI|nr:hypothetical protein ZHAS_00004609 [Anopheles sinensis]